MVPAVLCRTEPPSKFELKLTNVTWGWGASRPPGGREDKTTFPPEFRRRSITRVHAGIGGRTVTGHCKMSHPRKQISEDVANLRATLNGASGIGNGPSVAIGRDGVRSYC
jgi:hypothetical protein